MPIVTIIAATLVAAPAVAWLFSANPGLMVVAHLCALLLILRAYAVAAAISPRTRDVITMGLFSGLLGTLASEIFTHADWARNLPTFFAGYGAFGPALYRLDTGMRWWPFAFAGLNGLFWAAAAALINRLVRSRRPAVVAKRLSSH